MPRNSHFRLSEEIRWFIIEEKTKNVPPSLIIHEIKKNFHRSISYSTIRLTWRRYLETGGIDYVEPAGRPKSLNDREERQLVRSFIANPGQSIKSTVKLQNQQPIGRKTVSCRTVRRTLRRRGLVPRMSNSGSEVTPKNRKKRLKFAKDHASWNETDWSQVVFSDECTLFPMRTKTRVLWAPMGSERAPPYEENLKLKSINVWGFMRYDGRIELVRFEGTMKEAKYMELLEEHLDDAIAPMRRSRNELIFMQDNAKYHSAKDIGMFLRQNKKKILKWPAQSPDLSPMENLWAALKQELWNQRGKIKSSGDVWALSREIVRDFTLEFIHKLYESLPNRMELVIKNGGNRIVH